MIAGIQRALRFGRIWKGGIGRASEEEVEIQRGDRSVPATLIRPHAPSAPLPAWVVLHGVTRPGRHHPALVRFIRALAGTGAVVLVPEIPEWRDLYLAPDEAAATIRASVDMLEAERSTEPGGIGVMGFSLGVPQVLFSAIDPSLQGRLGGVAGFGGYGDLDRTIHFLFEGEHEWENHVYRMDPDPYGRWIVGGNYLTRIPGLEDAGDVATALIALAKKAGDMRVGAWDACYDSFKEELMTGVHPSRHDLFRTFAPSTGETPARELSRQLVPALAEAARTAAPHSEPLSFLHRITVPVRLVHGRGDRLIPFSESLRLEQAFPRDRDTRAYLTPLFSHSKEENSGGTGLGVEDHLGFLRILADLLTLV